MVQGLSISERRACRYAGLSRTSYREPPSMNQSTASLSTRIVELAHERRRFGYRRIHDLLSLEGHQVNHKRVWRLYKLANLSVRKRRKVKRPTGERQPLAASQHINDTWSADFVMDALANGRRIKCLTVVDDFSRECVDIAVDHGMGGEYVVRLLDQAAQFRGYWNTPLNLQTGCSGPTTSFPTPWTTCVSWPALLQPRRLATVSIPSAARQIQHHQSQRHRRCLEAATGPVSCSFVARSTSRQQPTP